MLFVDPSGDLAFGASAEDEPGNQQQGGDAIHDAFHCTDYRPGGW
jgi:hypothetical protein